MWQKTKQKRRQIATTRPPISSGTAAVVQRLRAHRRRPERQAFLLLTLLLAAVVTFWTPWFVYSVWGLFFGLEDDLFCTVAYWMAYAMSGVNPFLFNAASDEMRLTLRRLLDRCGCAWVRYQKRGTAGKLVMARACRSGRLGERLEGGDVSPSQNWQSSTIQSWGYILSNRISPCFLWIMVSDFCVLHLLNVFFSSDIFVSVLAVVQATPWDNQDRSDWASSTNISHGIAVHILAFVVWNVFFARGGGFGRSSKGSPLNQATTRCIPSTIIGHSVAVHNLAGVVWNVFLGGDGGSSRMATPNIFQFCSTSSQKFSAWKNIGLCSDSDRLFALVLSWFVSEKNVGVHFWSLNVKSSRSWIWGLRWSLQTLTPRIVSLCLKNSDTANIEKRKLNLEKDSGKTFKYRHYVDKKKY